MLKTAIRAFGLTILMLFFLAGLAHANSVTLTLDPVNGALTGAAGSTVGWSFTLTDTGPDFAVITSSDFCVGVITSPCTNSLGTYTDFAGPQFLVVGPSPENSSVTQSFDNTLLTGLGSFLINTGATSSVSGELVLTYDLYSLDPNSPDFNPLLDTISVGNYLIDAASVTVGTQAVPEPSSLLLLTPGLLGLGFLRRCTKRDGRGVPEVGKRLRRYGEPGYMADAPKIR